MTSVFMYKQEKFDRDESVKKTSISEAVYNDQKAKILSNPEIEPNKMLIEWTLGKVEEDLELELAAAAVTELLPVTV